METTEDEDLFVRPKTPNKQTVHICTFEGCTKQFGKPSRLLNHMRIHTGERPYKCTEPDCGKSYARQQHLSRHIEVSHSNSQLLTEFICETCDKICSNKYSLQKHEVRYHQRRKYKCTSCDKTFQKQQHLNRHLFTHTGIKPYKCTYEGCKCSFIYPSRLERHEKTHLPLRYQCSRENCPEAFDTFTQLRLHISIHHPQECDICKKEFNSISSLKKHRKTHQDVRIAYFCHINECGRCYYEEKNLRKHISDVHKKCSSHLCPICHKNFSTKQKLDDHVKKHSSDYNPVSKQKKKPKQRKDKGQSKKCIFSLLSGYQLHKDNGAKESSVSSCSDSLNSEESIRSISSSLNESSSDIELNDYSSDSGMSIDSTTLEQDSDLIDKKKTKPKVLPYAHIKNVLYEDF